MDNFFDNKSGWWNRPEWGNKARDLVKNLWETSYKGIKLHTECTVTAESPKRTLDQSHSSITDLSFNSNSFERFRSFKKPRISSESIEDELSRYMHWVSQNRHEVGQPIAWWIKARPLYPKLSILTLDAFSTPAMSAECERVFSRFLFL